MLSISSNLDSGNIEVVKVENPNDIQVKVRKDTNSDFLQYFFFRISGVEGESCKVTIVNASETTYPFWKEYNTYASYDKQNWFLVDTEYDGKQLIMEFDAVHSSIYLAYYPPYTYEQHLELVAECQSHALCKHSVLGQTVQGRDIDFLKIGFDTKFKKKIWVIARQHPGESMAEWFMQGFLKRLLDDSDPVARKLHQEAVFYVVPNMNIDGSILGNLRSNAAGANLNREWLNPSLETSPEVYHVLHKMDEVGLDMCLDVHGDEEIPYNFISAAEGIPNYTPKIAKLEKDFIEAWIRNSPDFQDKYGYDKDAPGTADLSICTPQLAERFGALALTIEMPFIDNHDLPDPMHGWAPQRSEKLGGSVLNPILELVKNL